MDTTATPSQPIHFLTFKPKRDLEFLARHPAPWTVEQMGRNLWLVRDATGSQVAATCAAVLAHAIAALPSLAVETGAVMRGACAVGYWVDVDGHEIDGSIPDDRIVPDGFHVETMGISPTPAPEAEFFYYDEEIQAAYLQSIPGQLGAVVATMQPGLVLTGDAAALAASVAPVPASESVA
jgi:hypothetical protein